MVGEAVRQITHSSVGTGYRLRHVVAHTALLVTEHKAAEMVTSLRRHRLTDSDDADWFDFSIASVSGSSWVKHCDGQVRVAAQPSPSAWSGSETLSRDVPHASLLRIHGQGRHRLRT